MAPTDVYGLARAIYQTFPTGDDYIDQFAAVIQAWRSNVPEMLERLEPVVKMSDVRASMWHMLVNTVRLAEQDPQAASLFVGIVESMPLIASVDDALDGSGTSPCSKVLDFIDCLCLDQPEVQHDQVMARIQTFLDSLDPVTRQAVSHVLNHQRHQQDDYMAQMHHILNDQALFEQFERIILDASVPWFDRLTDVYQLIKTRKPEVWDEVSLVLDRLESELDTKQYNSYEEYVQRNFLDDGGQQYLDNEVEQAKVEHMLGSMNM